jgi:hypothetical protein
MMQVKKLVLGSAKKTINVDVIENEEVIVVEKKCKITLEDFGNVHVVTTQQLVTVEKQLETALQSTIPSSMLANLKDFEGSSCENINSIQVHSEFNIT